MSHNIHLLHLQYNVHITFVKNPENEEATTLWLEYYISSFKNLSSSINYVWKMKMRLDARIKKFKEMRVKIRCIICISDWVPHFETGHLSCSIYLVVTFLIRLLFKLVCCCKRVWLKLVNKFTTLRMLVLVFASKNCAFLFQQHWWNDCKICPTDSKRTCQKVEMCLNLMIYINWIAVNVISSHFYWISNRRLESLEVSLMFIVNYVSVVLYPTLLKQSEKLITLKKWHDRLWREILRSLTRMWI